MIFSAPRDLLDSFYAFPTEISRGQVLGKPQLSGAEAVGASDGAFPKSIQGL